MDKYYVANAVFALFAKEYLELKKELPIRPSEMGVLNIITVNDGLFTPVMLAERLNVSKPMITTHLSSLSKKGYITKRPSIKDKRAYYIRPTEKGKELVKTSKSEMDKQLDWLIDEMGQEEFDKLVQLAKLATEILREKKGAHPRLL